MVSGQQDVAQSSPVPAPGEREPGDTNSATDDAGHDRAALLESISQGHRSEVPTIFARAPAELRADPEVAGPAVAKSWVAFQYASDALRRDRKFILSVIAAHGVAALLAYAPAELCRDREFMLACITGSLGFAMEHVVPELREDRQFVVDAVSRGGFALKFVREDFQSDHAVVLAALTSTPGRGVFKFAATELKTDRAFVLKAASKDGLALEYGAEEFREDKDLVLAAVAQDRRVLGLVSEELEEDDEFMLLANKTGLLAEIARAGTTDPPEPREVRVRDLLRKADEELQEDFELVQAAVLKDMAALKYAGDDIREDKKFVLEMIARDKAAFKYCSEDLQEDEDFVIAVDVLNAVTAKLAEAEAEISRLRDLLAQSGYNPNCG